MSLDTKDFYLNNVLPRKEHARLHLSVIPQTIIEQCNLKELADNEGFIHIETSKGMHGLPQAGRIASDFLLPCSQATGCHPTARTHGLFRHESNGITFCLVVDDFGVKFTDEAAAEHSRDALRKHCTITEDWEGNNCCGLDLEWNCAKKHVDVSVKGCVEKAL